jgi:CRP-like cAMP-binding protein
MGNEILPMSGLLGRMPGEAVAALASFAMEFPMASGDTIIYQGQEQFDLYFVIAGRVEVVAETGDKPVSLAFIEPGECFGEISIFQPGPASATVRVVASGKLWKLDADRLQGFLEGYPQEASMLLLGICEVLSQRLRNAVSLIKQIKVMPSFFSVRSRLRLQAPGGVA